MAMLKKLFLCSLLSMTLFASAEKYWDPAWGLEPAEGGDQQMIYISGVMGDILRFQLRQLITKQLIDLRNKCAIYSTGKCDAKESALQEQLDQLQ